MTRHRLFAILAIAFWAITVTHSPVVGNVLDRDWPSVLPTPAVDVPMRDTAITRGPDLSAVPAQAGGTYYLTGTLQGGNAKGELDFDNGQQIKLWKSADLKRWEEIGVVWDLREDVLGPKGDRTFTTISWMR